ncbi:lytic transglycosylase domain-containing protein [Amycolatopsis sp. NPDC051071]|uniref:lytic transglycosylase domain-containing protein n=1 Tax=Amycolatopsis sp. NPDC051071 TaxID=3154637 RepID=UPI00341D1C05
MTDSNSDGHRVPRHPPVSLLGLSAALLIAVGASAAPAAVRPADGSAPPAPLPARQPDRPPGADGDTPPTAPPPSGALPSIADGRPLPPVPRLGDGGAVALTNGIPAAVLDAYRNAQSRLTALQPNCRVPVALLAAIGKVESGHARGGRLDSAGTTVQPILGPVLKGGPYAAISDTDGGTWDGDPVWDRAVGPMQFIPGTWARWASDGNGDSLASPHNMYDAALAGARYLCAGGRDLATSGGLTSAVLSYNHSTSYLNLVLAWMNTYNGGMTAQPGNQEQTLARAASVPSPQVPVTVPSVPPSPQPSPTAPVQPPPAALQPTPGPSPAPPPSPPPGVPAVPGPDAVPGALCDVTSVVETILGIVGGLLGPAPSTAAPVPCVPPSPVGH